METESQTTKRRATQRSMINLSEDLIIEILLWLPLLSILRFRCVCKSWCKLLDLKFINTKLKNPFKLLVTKEDPVNHRNETHLNVEMKSLMSNEEAVGIMYPFKKSSGWIRILGSCHGLVCASGPSGYFGSGFYVWNPCTAEYKEIIGVRESESHVRVQGYGFGYDSRTRDYKFVTFFRVSMEFNDGCSNVDIYTLSSGSWKEHNSEIPYQVRSNGGRVVGVFLNGALHWLADLSPFRYMYEYFEPRVILSFDMEEEKYKEILLPAELMDDLDDFDYKYVTVFRGCLCLLCNVSNVRFEIWEMKDYGVRESWSKVFKTDCQELMTMGIPSCHSIRGIVSLTNGEILLAINMKDEPYWQPRVDVVRIHLGEKKVYEYMKNILGMEAYVESLVSVKSGTFVGDEQNDSYNAVGA